MTAIQHRDNVFNAWRSTMRDLHIADSVCQPHWDKVLSLYSEPHRHYHTISHISEVLDQLRRYGPGDSNDYILAAIYHDAIYDTTAGDSEERSAELARSTLCEFAAPAVLVDRVTTFILCTKDHRPAADYADECALFLDCDLLILAAPPEKYNLYCSQIRQEYKQYDDAMYKFGRSRILSKFLEREQIYFTDKIRETCEEQARANIAAELNALL